MPHIIYQHTILRSDLRVNPHVVYIFGDNMKRTGTGGQAKEMRGECNAVGIPTKWEPWSYFSDDEDLSIPKLAIENILHSLKNEEVIVFPSRGIGTGLASLASKAPGFKDWLDAILDRTLGIKNP